ncbi:LOW QUALITY PROTEIN: hypothetical protein V1478_003951 [Vespula squamosa]|uniref:Uncharacterized protein n=1 Tax=Vespula squamosa TaxID=30214 RepID=A0ABD2BPN7_VESSQ
MRLRQRFLELAAKKTTSIFRHCELLYLSFNLDPSCSMIEFNDYLSLEKDSHASKLTNLLSVDEMDHIARFRNSKIAKSTFLLRSRYNTSLFCKIDLDFKYNVFVLVNISKMCVYNGLDGVNLGSCKYHCKSEFNVFPENLDFLFMKNNKNNNIYSPFSQIFKESVDLISTEAMRLRIGAETSDKFFKSSSPKQITNRS